MIKKNVAGFLFLFFISITTSHAGSLEVAQWIPWSFLKTEMMKTPVSISQVNNNTALSFGELTPIARSLSFSVDGVMSEVNIDAVGIEASAPALSAKIVISELVIDQIVVRNISGNVIRVHINAVCTPVTISVSQFRADLSGNFMEQNGWNINLSDINLSFPAGSWTVGPMTCSGLSGVDQQITATIANNLKSPALLQQFLRERLAPVISDSWTKQWTSLVTSAEGTLQNIQIQRPHDLGLQITAEIPLTNGTDVALPEVDFATLSTTAPQLLLSTAGFNALIKDKLISAAPQKYNLQNLTAFYNLMRSPVKQYLVFPDLKKFDFDAYFGLSTNNAASNLVLSAKTSKTYNAHLTTKGIVEVKKGQASVPYIDWTIDLTTILTVSMKDSVLSLKTNVPTTTINWLFNKTYLNNYATNTRVSSTIITSSILSVFTSQSTKQELPVLNWQNRVMKLQSWKQAKELITMDWVE